MFEFISYYIFELGMLSSISIVFFAYALDIATASRGMVHSSVKNIIKGAIILSIISIVVIAY